MADEKKNEVIADAPPALEEQPPALEEQPPALEEQQQPQEAQTGAGAEKKQTRNEKKSRKALQKLGLKPFPGVQRVTIKQRQGTFVIVDAEVYKGGSDTYIIFGQAQSEDALFNQGRAKQNLQDVLKGGNLGDLQSKLGDLAQAEAAPAEPESNKDEGNVDNGGLSEVDIDLVMKQANVSKAKAVETLKQTGDVVKAIMELSGAKV